MSRLLRFAQPSISADGRLVAVPLDRGVWLASGDSGEARFVPCPHIVSVLGIAADGSTVAAAGDGRLSLVAATSAAVTWTVSYDGSVRRLGLTAGLLAAVIDQQVTTLRTYRAADGAPLATGPGWPAVEIDGLLAARGQALVWGRQGRDLDHHAGDRFARLCDLSAGVDEVFTGAGAPSRPQGFVFPLDEKAIGAYDADTLMTLSPGAEGWSEIARRPWDGTALTTGSPSGNQLITLAAEWDGAFETTVVRVIRWADGETVGVATSGAMSGRTAAAVDDAGAATVAEVGPDDRLRVWRLRGAGLDLCLDLDLGSAA